MSSLGLLEIAEWEPWCSSNFRYGGRKRLFSRKQRPMLVFAGQYQTYAVFSYL